MTEKKKEINNEEIEETKENETNEVNDEIEETETKIENKTDETESLKNEVKEINDKYLRLMAEFDNYKKRTASERSQIYVSAAADIIEAVLPFVDNISRAVAVETECDEATKVIEGVKLIQRQFEDTLKKLGVEEIKCVGETFDPNMHNAVMHIDDESIDGEDVIVEEFAKGYTYKNKVIRHSTVKVAN